MNYLKSKNTARLVKLGQKLRKTNAIITTTLADYGALDKETREGEAKTKTNELLLKHIKRRTQLRIEMLAMLIVDPFGDELDSLSGDKEYSTVSSIPRTFNHYETKYAYLLNNPMDYLAMGDDNDT